MPTIAVLALAFREFDAPWAGPRRTVVEFPLVKNLSGDSDLDLLGELTEDVLAGAFSTVEFLRLDETENPDRATARVTGALFPRGELVEARLRVQEAATGRVLGTATQLLPTTSDPGAALDSLVGQVLVTLAAQYDPRFDASGGEAPTLPIRLPEYDALIQYYRGSQLFGTQDYAAAAPFFFRAYEIDPRFGKAAVFGSIALAWAGQPAAADSFATVVLAENDSLTDFDRAFGGWFLADLRGHRGIAYRAANEYERAGAGASPPALAVAAHEAIRFNRPQEALRKLARVDTKHGWLRTFTPLLEEWAGAFHVVGDHRSELDKALEGRSRFPESLELIRAEVRARAALRQPGEVERLIEEAMTRSPDGVRAAEVAWVGAQELAAHGQGSAAVSARGIALDWLAHCEPLTAQGTLLRARLLLESGDVEGAHEVLDTLPPLPDLNWMALQGLVAASRGDTATAREALATLETMDNPYLSGRHLLHAAGIRAALGEPEEAVRALQRAFAEGLPYGVDLHALPALSPLAGRKDFLRILRPRG